MSSSCNQTYHHSTPRLFLICLMVAAMAACGGPTFMLPGGELSGALVTEPVTDWSFAQSDFMDLETNADGPRSVKLNYVVQDGKLYIDPAEDRAWFEHLRANLDVRVRFDNNIYPVRANLVGKPGELPGFDADRFIYQLVSRPLAAD